MFSSNRRTVHPIALILRQVFILILVLAVHPPLPTAAEKGSASDLLLNEHFCRMPHFTSCPQGLLAAGTDFHDKPLLQLYRWDGECIFSYQSPLDGWTYSDAAMLSDGTIIATRLNEFSCVDFIRDGRLVYSMQPFAQLRRLIADGDRFVLSISKASETLIVCYDSRAQEQWRCALPGSAALSGYLHGETDVIMGTYDQDEGEAFLFEVFADGLLRSVPCVLQSRSVLGCADSMGIAFFLESGKNHVSTLIAVGEDGQPRFEKSYPASSYEKDGFPRAAVSWGAFDLKPVSDGYAAILKMNYPWQNALLLRLFDADGNLTEECLRSFPELLSIQEARLLTDGNALHIAVYGEENREEGLDLEYSQRKFHLIFRSVCSE